MAEDLEGLVRDAAAIAAQDVAAIHRVRLVRQTFAAALIAALLVALPVTLLIGHHVHAAGQANSRYDCQLLGHVANQLGAFIRTDAVDRQGALTKAQRAQVLSGFAQIIEPGLLRRATAAQQSLDQRTIDYWNTLLARLRAFATVNCQAAIR